MTTDALDPGPDGSYPYMPRNPDGTLDTQRMPVGARVHREGHRRILIDPEPTMDNGVRPSDVVPLPTEST